MSWAKSGKRPFHDAAVGESFSDLHGAVLRAVVIEKNFIELF